MISVAPQVVCRMVMMFELCRATACTMTLYVWVKGIAIFPLIVGNIRDEGGTIDLAVWLFVYLFRFNVLSRSLPWSIRTGEAQC